jgi:hypothetical protein
MVGRESVDLMLNLAPAPDDLEVLADPFLRANGFEAGRQLFFLRGGANNRVCLVQAGSRRAVIKHYFLNPRDRRDRFGAERAFYTHVLSTGSRRTPEPLAWNEEHRLGLFEWIDGRKLEPREVNRAFVEQALVFIRELNHGRGRATVPMASASEACFSIEEHLRCVGNRVQRVSEMLSKLRQASHPSEEAEVDREAELFARDILGEIWPRLFSRVRAAADKQRLLFSSLPQESRCVSPSDFGFHNALLEPGGELRFFDFEYAGWDDPAKLIGDFFCQPEIPVPLVHWDIFCSGLLPEFSSDPDLSTRARLLLPVYQVKWCCIMLNDFLVDGGERRGFSLGSDDLCLRKRAQLKKARLALGRLDEDGEMRADLFSGG